MIIIDRPEVVVRDNKSRLQAIIDVDGEKKQIWYEVDNHYKQYLCYERSDAFVIALLNYAMREGHDITCKAPMGEELYYQITTYLIDAVFKGSKTLYNTKIFAEIDTSKLLTSKAVGTGISAGIDSFHAIANHTTSKFKKHNITHLSFFNVGSHGEGVRAKELYLERLNLARSFAQEYNYEFVESNSNLHDEFLESHLLAHTYRSSFAIYCMQKLYSVYYYASSVPFMEFSLKNNENYGPGLYDLLTLSMFSTRTLKIHSEGGTLSRFEKTKTVADFKPSYKYLNVCTRSLDNCGKCEKCIRTILALDAIDKLDNFKSVFDVEYYRNNKQKYFETLVQRKLMKDSNYVEVYSVFKNQINYKTRLKGSIKIIKPFLSALLPNKIKTLLKRMF